MRHTLYRTFALLLASLLLASCAMMTEDRSKCPTCYNPLHVVLDYTPYRINQDNFVPHGVNSAVCYLLDAEDNILAKQVSNDALLLKQPDYAFNFEDLAAGSYKTLTVSAQQPFGSATPNRPYITDLAEGDNIRQLQFRVPRADTPDADGYYHVDNTQALDSVYLMMTMADANKQTTTLLQLADYDPLTVYAQPMRLTNNLNFMVTQLEDPAANDAAKYEVRVTDHNGWLDYRAQPLDATPLVYTPFAQWNTETLEEPSTPSAAPATRAPGDVLSRTAHYDISLHRLITHPNAQDNARLQLINRQDGTVILDIDLIHYLLLLRNSYETRLTPQQFLDLRDDFRIAVVLDGNKWRYMTISINVLAWSLRIQNETL